ncbi:hypothetical protein PENTCL1PPCAC_12553, partial [Pristionchus entomophagus]
SLLFQGPNRMNALKEYARRFTPFLLGRILRTDPKTIRKTIIVDSEQVAAQLKSVIAKLNDSFRYPVLLDGETRKSMAEIRHEMRSLLFEELGFELRREKSSVCEGEGVFLSRGATSSHTLFCLYPGTLYGLGDPILIQSLGNSFILKCRDGQMIDGNDRRISRSIFKSCAYRDFGHRVCDLTWLERDPVTGSAVDPANFLNMGQYVNDARDVKGNVQYIDVDIIDWPLSLRRWLPYATYRPREGGIAGVHDGIPLRIVALVSTREIHEGEELLADYLSC